MAIGIKLDEPSTMLPEEREAFETGWRENHKLLIQHELKRDEYAGLTADDAFEKMTTRPVLVETTSRPSTWGRDSVFNCINPSSLARLLDVKTFPLFDEAVSSQDKDSVLRHADLYRRAGLLTQVEFSVIESCVNAVMSVETRTTQPSRFDLFARSVPFMPNELDRPLFDAAYQEAQR